MASVTTWTGREANALRLALRLSLTDFADRLGVARRTAATWSSRGAEIKLRVDMQAACDTLLGRMSDDERERFVRLAGPHGSPPPTDQVRREAHIGPAIDRQRLVPVPAAPPVAINPAIAAVVDAILFPPRAAAGGSPRSVSGLEHGVSGAKTQYQRCAYALALGRLPGLLAHCAGLEPHTTGDRRLRLHRAATDLFHVVASSLLKAGESALALVAAEHSVRHAAASADPIAGATSARIMTHALTRNGHAAKAANLALAAAQTLATESGLEQSAAVSAYGALLLRGAVAAARAGDRHTASGLLAEAGQRAGTATVDRNERWTGFGPANVQLHEVSVALAVGDAGTALAVADRVQLDRVTLVERKARFFIDVATAFAQWGRHEQALSALQSAYNTADEEVRSRPAVHRVVADLATLARGPVRAHVQDFASAAGILL